MAFNPTGLGTFLKARQPQLGERLCVQNPCNIHRDRWGIVVAYDETFDMYQMTFDIDKTDAPWFHRFELWWDHGR